MPKNGVKKLGPYKEISPKRRGGPYNPPFFLKTHVVPSKNPFPPLNLFLRALPPF